MKHRTEGQANYAQQFKYYFDQTSLSCALGEAECVLFSLLSRSRLRGMERLFPLNIPLRWRHQQFTRLTCPYTTLEMTKETQGQNTPRVESGKCSQAATDVTC